MQDQIQFRLAIGAARSTLPWREDLRGIVEPQSTAESNQVIDVIVVEQQSQRQLNVFNKFLQRFRPIDAATAAPTVAK